MSEPVASVGDCSCGEMAGLGRAKRGQPGKSLTYKGDGWYSAVLNETVELSLTYNNASDYMVGDWTLADIVIDKTTVIHANCDLNPDSDLVRWLEDEARKGGRLPDEPSDTCV